MHTTAERIFAEGFQPSAKAIRPSAKGSLPRAFCRALGKDFAEG